MLAAVPEIEENIPLPASAATAVPDLTPHEELAMRARTIKLLSDMTDQAIAPTGEQMAVAVNLAKQMIENPEYRPTFAHYPDETLSYLAGLVGRFNVKIVDELSDLKLYVVNRLVYEAETAKDSKTRLTALSRLGEIDGVDAFKKRSEMTMLVKPIEEVEKELLSVLSNIEYRVVNPAEKALRPSSEPENTENPAPFEPETPFQDTFAVLPAPGEVEQESSGA